MTELQSRKDPVLASLVDDNLRAITREMGLALTHATSSIYFNAGDMCTGILDEKARILCQVEYLPLMAYTFPPALRELINFFEGEIYDGDIFIHNDVFYGCNQLQDLAVFKPVFHGGELCFWVGTKGHEQDLGGPVMSGTNPKAREIWQETIRLPPIKLQEKGRFRRDVWNMMLANCRLPTQVGRDIRAQIGGCIVGERRLRRLIERHSMVVLKDQIEYVLDSSEASAKEQIRKIPEGVYESSAATRGDGVSNDEFVAKMRATIKDGTITLDFRGTDTQSPGYVNGVYSTSFSAAVAVLFMCLDPDLAHNEGSIRPIKVEIPAGTFLNANYPAATGGGNFTCNSVIGACILLAFSKVIPERIIAGWSRVLQCIITGTDPTTGKDDFINLFVIAKRGGGAGFGADGWNCLDQISTQRTRNGFVDYEDFEARHPYRILNADYRIDSGGPGKWRGGLGTHLKLLVNALNPELNITGDGGTYAAFGLLGGKSGKPSELRYTEPRKEAILTATNEFCKISQGTVIEFLESGGGGFGYPEERDLDAVALDVKNGVVSTESAMRDYLVVVDEKGVVDVEATRSVRLKKPEKGY